MKTLLLCGYRTSDQDEEALGLQRDTLGVTHLDRRIEQLQALGCDITCVLSGASADEQLRHCRGIESCELVFDTFEPGCTLLSNARAGAFALERESAMLFPLEIPPPDLAVWRFLINELAKVGYGTPATFLQVAEHGAPSHFGFPLLLTRKGAEQLRETTDLTSLVDPRLTYLKLELAREAELEPAAKPL